jgi:hypothetical protein
MSSGGREGGDAGVGGALAAAVKGVPDGKSGENGAPPLPPGLAKEASIASAVGDGGLSEIAATMSRQTEEAAQGGGASGLVAQVLGIVYPSLRPILSNSVRRVTISVRWDEGPTEREFKLVQFVTNPTIAAQAMGAGLPGGPGGPGAGPGGAAPGSGK